MAKKNDYPYLTAEQSWLTKTPWLSALIFFCTYAVVGWKLAEKSESLILFWQEKGGNLGLYIEDDLLLILIRIFTLFLIILVSLSLTTPVALITFVFEESLNSDIKAFIYIFLWSIFAVFILCYFDFFADLLVIVSANILLRLDLQSLKLKMWQIIFLIIFLATIAFCSGLFLSEYLLTDK